MISEYAAAQALCEPRRNAWLFARRLRRGTFGWRSARAANTTIRAAVAEIRRAAQSDAAFAAEGAVRLIERLAPTLEQVDRTSGRLETTVERAIVLLADIIGDAPLEHPKRMKLLNRLWQALEDDRAGYLESLEDVWGRYCGSAEVASAWADDHLCLLHESEVRTYVQGTTATLSALLAAGRYDEIISRVARIGNAGWAYRRWGFKALVAQGRPAAALHYAEASRSFSDPELESACEELFLVRGMQEEAYRRYGMGAAPFRASNLATFRAMRRKYTRIDPAQILANLATTTAPGRESRWFGTAVSAGFYDLALAFAQTSPADPRVLMRAAQAHSSSQPGFAKAAMEMALTSVMHEPCKISAAEVVEAERFVRLARRAAIART